MLTTAQLNLIKADIQASVDMTSIANDEPGAAAIASLYNASASPDFFVWKTEVLEDDIFSKTSTDGTNWSWPAYINRSQREGDGWMRMFRSGKVNPSLPNVRQGFTDIFSNGPTGAAAQRTHLNAICKRKATRMEKLLADSTGGNGATATPAALTFEGAVTLEDILKARA